MKKILLCNKLTHSFTFSSKHEKQLLVQFYQELSTIKNPYNYKNMDNQNYANTPYLQKQRDKKHKQIMTAIYNYKRNSEQIKMLDKVKQATNMEINLRYKNSSHNHSYKFPLFQNSFDEDQDEFPNSNQVLYDLHMQTEVVKKSVSTKTLSLDASRRVKSLEKEHVGDDQQIVGKIHRRPILGKAQEISDLTLRKNSLKDRRSRNRSNLRLPELKKVPSEKKNPLQQIVGKKIHTETSSPDSKRLAKYLKGVQSSSKQIKQQPKRFFLQQI